MGHTFRRELEGGLGGDLDERAAIYKVLPIRNGHGSQRPRAPGHCFFGVRPSAAEDMGYEPRKKYRLICLHLSFGYKSGVEVDRSSRMLLIKLNMMHKGDS